MTDFETRERIDEQAARWAARRALSDTTDAQDADFQVWLAANRLHQGAYLRAQAAFFAMQDAVLASPVPVASNDDDPVAGSRAETASWWTKHLRPALAAGVTIAACVTAVVLVRTPDVSVPPVGSTQQTLADGSKVVVGNGGAISSAMDGRTRRITLERGSATFHVAKDRSRPFIVRSGQVYAEATGTVYSVRRMGSAGGAIRVSEGSVRVWAKAARNKAVLLQAGQALSLDPAAPRPTASAHADFAFANVSIAEAAARFNSVNTTRIVIGDRAIGRVKIIGAFKPDRPADFAQAAAAITGARVIERHGTLVIDKK